MTEQEWLTPERLTELRRIAEAAVPGKWSGQDFQLAMTPRTALALLDRIEELERRNSEIAQLIIDAITWFYDEGTGSVAVDESDRKRGLERLRQVLFMLDPAAAERFPQFWQW